MTQNLDKLVVPVKDQSDLLNSELGFNVDDDDNMQFDDDGNLVLTDEEKECIEGEQSEGEQEDVDNDDDGDNTDAEQEDSSQEPDEDVAKKKPQDTVKPTPDKSNKSISKEQLKIINQKKELQKVLAEKRELEERLSKIDGEQKKSELIKKYVDEGIDEDVAKKYAEQELRNSQIEEKLEIIDFKETNYELLEKYPQARQDVKTIIRNSKLTGMTPEQICRAMYADTQSYEQRLRKEMVSGTPKQPQSIESVARGAVKKESATLSASDRAIKQRLEKMFNNGKPLSDEEYKIVSKHFN